MKKLVLIFLFLVVACPGWSLTYMAYEDFGGQWYDADKSGGDSQMCWAASVSNVLSYTGWSMGMDENQVFDVYRDNFPNSGNYFESALAYWFEGQDLIGVSTGGGGYYQNEDYQDFYVRSTYWAADIMGDIDKWLHDGYGVDICIDGFQGHALTVYGIDYDSSGYNGLWVADGNDGSDSLIYLSMHSVTKDDFYFGNTVWVIDGPKYNGWVLNTASGLSRNNAAPVPEPATALLIILGLHFHTANRYRSNRRC